MSASKYTRDDLIAICERSFVPEAEWRDRDTSAAQRQLGECHALLKAGCDFVIRRDMGGSPNMTIWLAIEFKGFGYFDYGGTTEDETYYLPTTERLEQVAGRDWY